METFVAIGDSFTPLQAAGCRVLIFTGFDPRMFPVIRLLRGRIAAYNMHLRGIASAPSASAPSASAPSARVSAAGAPATHAPAAGAPATRTPAAAWARRAEWLAARRQDARWAREYATPWLRRRLTGASSGDGLLPKRPDLRPV